MSGKAEKSSADESKEEDIVDKLVSDWIEQNSAEFTISGEYVDFKKKENENKLRFRPRILDRCKQYKGAPDEYLKTMLETLQESYKWYFDVFETIFLAGLFGLFVTLTILTINNFLSSVQTSFSDWIGWVVPLCILVFLGASAILTRKVSKSSYLSHFIQHRFRIVHNLTELKIEMYYISNLIKIREAKKEPTTFKTT